MNINNLISSNLLTQKSTSAEYKSIFDKQQSVNNDVDKKINSNKTKRQESLKERNNKIFGNITKSLIPVITLQITNQLSQIYTQNSKLSDLVDKTNEFILNIKTQNDVNQARILRDTAINLINNNEQKILGIKTSLDKINSFIQIFNILINIFSAIAIPSAVPPGIGIPINIITGISKQIERSTKLVSGLSSVLSITTYVLIRMINNLEELKARLRQINDILEIKTTSDLSSDELNEFLNSLRQTNIQQQ